MVSPGGLPVGILGGGVQTKKSHFQTRFQTQPYGQKLS